MRGRKDRHDELRDDDGEERRPQPQQQARGRDSSHAFAAASSARLASRKMTSAATAEPTVSTSKRHRVEAEQLQQHDRLPAEPAGAPIAGAAHDHQQAGSIEQRDAVPTAAPRIIAVAPEWPIEPRRQQRRGEARGVEQSKTVRPQRQLGCGAPASARSASGRLPPPRIRAISRSTARMAHGISEGQQRIRPRLLPENTSIGEQARQESRRCRRATAAGRWDRCRSSSMAACHDDRHRQRR